MTIEDSFQEYTCDVCGAPATNASRDIQEVPARGRYKEFKHHGNVRIGCDKHPTKSCTFDHHGRLLDGQD